MYKLFFFCLVISIGNTFAAVNFPSFLIVNKELEVKQQKKETDRFFFNSIFKSCLTKKLQKFYKEISKLHQENFLDGEFLAAKDSKILLHLRSDDVAKIAKNAGKSTQFMIGSTSKQFFAATLLKALYENFAVGKSEKRKTKEVKKLLHLSLSHFLPKNAPIWKDKMPNWANTITLHQLLSHTSGIPDYTEKPEYLAKNSSGKRECEIPHSIAEIMQIVLKYPLNFTPGSKYLYSNTDYLLIYEVISKITNMDASVYIQKAIFDPLGLSSTFSPQKGNSVQLRKSDPRSSRLIPQYVYDPTEDPVITQPPPYLVDVSWAQGAGSIISTASDLLKWNIALHEKKIVLPDSLYKLLIKKNLGGYAYGFFVQNLCKGIILFHPGRIGNYTANLVYLPKGKISIMRFAHICIYSPEIEKETKKMMEEFKDQIPDELQRAAIVRKKIIKKYPEVRGNYRGEDIFTSFLNE